MSDTSHYPADPAHEACLRCWADGWRARDATIDRLTRENDRLWLLAYCSPSERAEIRRSRMDEGFRAMTGSSSELTRYE